LNLRPLGYEHHGTRLSRLGRSQVVSLTSARKPKGGPRNAIRRVPVPPVLVTMLREHVEAYGAAPDGRLFQTVQGGIYLRSTLWHVLRKAREQAFTQAQLASPLIRKPYDFRHAGVSWRLNAGTPAPLVAEWGPSREGWP
jgi:integrase